MCSTTVCKTVHLLWQIVVNAALILKSLEQSSGYSPTLLLAGGLQIWYALDFFWFEDGFLASFEVMYEGTGYMLALGYNMYPFIPTIITRFVLIYRFVVCIFCLVRITIYYRCWSPSSLWFILHLENTARDIHWCLHLVYGLPLPIFP